MLLSKLVLNRTTIIIGVIVLLVIALGIQTERAARLRAGKRIAENERDQALNFANTTITEYKNKNGELISKVEVTELTLNNLQKLRETERLKFLKQFDKLKKDLRNLESAGNFEWLIDEDSIPSIAVTIPCTDSLRAFKYELIDEFNTIRALVIDTPQIDIRVPFYTTVFWERRKKFLWWKVGPKQFTLESFSPNRLVKITKQELIKVEKK